MLGFSEPEGCVLVALGHSTPGMDRMSVQELAETLQDGLQSGDSSSQEWHGGASHGRQRGHTQPSPSLRLGLSLRCHQLISTGPTCNLGGDTQDSP